MKKFMTLKLSNEDKKMHIARKIIKITVDDIYAAYIKAKYNNSSS